MRRFLVCQERQGAACDSHRLFLLKGGLMLQQETAGSFLAANALVKQRAMMELS